MNKIVQKIRQYQQLTKMSLSILVVFSSIMSYLMVEKVHLDWGMVGYLFCGGFLITASANTLNQIIERETDALMARTAQRPLASRNMSIFEAQCFAFVCALLGFFILWQQFNITAALLSLLSLALYAWVYTPFKKINSLSVFMGGIPGALPCLIGWAAGDPTHMAGGWALFAFQFMWQFPHFWAIAWLAHKDYEKAGFKLLPDVAGPTQYTAIQTLIYSLILFPIGCIPFWLNMSGYISLIIIFAANVWMTSQSYLLYKHQTQKAARRVMFSSYLYLAVVYWALYWDKL